MMKQNSILPIVSLDTSSNAMGNIMANVDYKDRQLEIILKENPDLAQWLIKFSEKLTDIDNVLYSTLIVYDLLNKSGTLPRVDRATLQSFGVEAGISVNKTYEESLAKHLNEVNPNIASFLANFAPSAKKPNEVVYATLYLYRILEIQALKEKVLFNTTQ